MEFGPFRAMRREMLLAVGRHFPPDLVLVDQMPAGLAGELTPMLRELQRAAPGTRFVLGLRDIAGNGPIIRQIWSRYGDDALLEELYDRILVFGQRDVYDVVEQLGLSPRVAAKVRYVGYLRRERRTRSPQQVRHELELQTDRLVLVTVGGGGDGSSTLHAVLQALRSSSEALGFDCVVVAGPLMPVAEREQLRELLPPDGSIRLLDAVVDLVDYVAAADVVVARAGYNTICEILSFARPAVLIPRVTVDGKVANPNELLRAEALAQRGLARLIRPDALTPERLLGAIEELLAQPDLPRLVPGLDLNGLPATVRQLEALLGRQPPG
jgi:predicted glycosyltransferase